MSLPGKGPERHICPTIVMCHLERRELGGANKIITLWSGGHVFSMYGE